MTASRKHSYWQSFRIRLENAARCPGAFTCKGHPPTSTTPVDLDAQRWETSMDHELQTHQEEQQQCRRDNKVENRHSDRRHKQPGENSIRCPRHAIPRIGHLRLIGVHKRLHFRQWCIDPGCFFVIAVSTVVTAPALAFASMTLKSCTAGSASCARSDIATSWSFSVGTADARKAIQSHSCAV